MPAAQQRENFDGCLADTVKGDFEILRSVHSQICEMVEEHKNEKTEEPLFLNKRVLTEALQSGGADEKQTEAFCAKFDESFGEHAEVPPQNLLDLKTFSVKTPDVSIKVNPDRTDLISTQIIGGTKYILIRADEEIEVNGVPLS